MLGEGGVEAAICQLAIPQRHQIEHQREYGRLGSADIISAGAVRHMAETRDQGGEYLDHRIGQIGAVADEAVQGEIAVPIIYFAEATARHDVRPGDSKGRAALLNRRAGEYVPQAADAIAQRLVWRWRDGADVFRKCEILMNEG